MGVFFGFVPFQKLAFVAQVQVVFFFDPLQEVFGGPVVFNQLELGLSLLFILFIELVSLLLTLADQLLEVYFLSFLRHLHLFWLVQTRILFGSCRLSTLNFHSFFRFGQFGKSIDLGLFRQLQVSSMVGFELC